MRKIKLGLGLIAMLAFGIAMTATASAASFLSSAKEKLLYTNVSEQAFVTEAGTAECSNEAVTAGESAGAETTEEDVTVQYSGCTAFGFLEATISPAEYGLSTEGEVFIKKLISIKTIGCEVSVPAQSVNKMDYATKGNNLLFEPLISGIEYTVSGSVCAKTGAFANGTYKGHSEMMIAHGTLSYMSTGGGEKQKISITPNEGNVGGGKCPENAKKEVEFGAVKEWCEYRVKNENAIEEVTVQKIELGLFPECVGLTCLVRKNAISIPECSEALKTKLAAGASCFVAVEYNKKPAVAQKTKLRVETKSAGGVVARPQVSQTVK